MKEMMVVPAVRKAVEFPPIRCVVNEVSLTEVEAAQRRVEELTSQLKERSVSAESSSLQKAGSASDSALPKAGSGESSCSLQQARQTLKELRTVLLCDRPHG